MGAPRTEAPAQASKASLGAALRRHDLEGALASYEALPEELRARSSLKLSLATIRLLQGRLEEAFFALPKPEESSPYEAERRLLLGRILRAGLPLPHAAEALKEASRRAAPSSRELIEDTASVLATAISGEQVDAVVEIARTLSSSGQVERMHPRAVALAHFALALKENTQKNRTATLRHLQRVLALSPEPELSQKARALISSMGGVLGQEEVRRALTSYAERGRWEELERELLQLGDAAVLKLGLNPESLRGKCLYAARVRLEEGAKWLERAQARHDKDEDELALLEGKTWLRAQKLDRALEVFAKLATKKRGFAEAAAFQRSRTLLLLGRHAEALRSYKEYTKQYGKSSRNKASVAYDLALATLLSGQYETASRSFLELKARAKDPIEAARLAELAYAGKELAGLTDEAIFGYREIVSARPLSLPALLSRARLLALGEELPPLLPAARESLPALPQVALPPSVLELSELGLDALAEEHLRGFEDSIRRSHGEAADGVLCELYGQLSSAMRRYRIAQTATSLSILLSEPETNSLWQNHCAYPRPYLDLVRKAAADSGVEPAFIYGVMRQESAFRPEVVSSAEAIGLMQLIPPTAARVAQELAWPEAPQSLHLPAVSVRLGAHYLGKLSRMFRERSELAAAAYNAGPLSVATWLRGSPGLPLDLFLAKIPYEETRTYVHRVMGNTARYLYLEGVDPKKFDLDLKLPEEVSVTEDAY